MPESSVTPHFIKSRGQAIAVVCFTLFLAGEHFWELAKRHTPKFEWLYAGWPTWFALPANLLTYAVFVTYLIFAIREFRGPERIILSILIAQTLVSPLRNLVPLTLAEAIFWIQGFASLAMVWASLQLFLLVSRRQSSRPTAQS